MRTLDEIKLAAHSYRVSVRKSEAWPPDEFSRWDRAIEQGKDYLAGSTVSTANFIRSHTTACSPWQRLAFDWCKANPGETLNLRNVLLEYDCYWRGEFCVIGLPHQDLGGEKHWITRNGKTKVLVNVD